MKFDEIALNIQATKGHISKSEYEDKILEALKQMGIKFHEEGDV